MTLTYGFNQDMDKALVHAAEQIIGGTACLMMLPRHSSEGSNSDDSPIARLALVAKDGFDVNLETLGQYLDTNIVEPLSRTKWYFRS